MSRQVAIEALVVSLTTVVLFAIVHFLDMKIRGEVAAMTHASLLTHAALTGALVHVLYEITGLNAYYVRLKTK